MYWYGELNPRTSREILESFCIHECPFVSSLGRSWILVWLATQRMRWLVMLWHVGTGLQRSSSTGCITVKQVRAMAHWYHLCVFHLLQNIFTFLSIKTGTNIALIAFWVLSGCLAPAEAPPEHRVVRHSFWTQELNCLSQQNLGGTRSQEATSKESSHTHVCFSATYWQTTFWVKFWEFSFFVHDIFMSNSWDTEIPKPLKPSCVCSLGRPVACSKVLSPETASRLCWTPRTTG